MSGMFYRLCWPHKLMNFFLVFFIFQFLCVIFEVRTQGFYFAYALIRVGDRDNSPFPILIASCFCNKGWHSQTWLLCYHKTTCFMGCPIWYLCVFQIDPQGKFPYFIRRLHSYCFANIMNQYWCIALCTSWLLSVHMDDITNTVIYKFLF